MTTAGVSNTDVGDVESKEPRLGVPSSSLYDVTSTQTSTGSVNSAADSYTIGGFAMLTGMMFGEVHPGGVGTGLYSMLLFAVITVFIGELMVGRTPEYLGKKIQATEVKLATLGVLVMPMTVLVLTAIHGDQCRPDRAATMPARTGLRSIRLHLADQQRWLGVRKDDANTPFYNITGTIGLLFGQLRDHRAGAGAGRKDGRQRGRADGLGTFRTDKPMFAGLLTAVVLIVGALASSRRSRLDQSSNKSAAGSFC